MPKNKVSDDDEVRLAAMLEEIDDPDLKETLAKLGRGIISKQIK